MSSNRPNYSTVATGRRALQIDTWLTLVATWYSWQLVNGRHHFVAELPSGVRPWPPN